MREELRPCIVKTMKIEHGWKIGKVVCENDKAREAQEVMEEKAETHKGHFHRWIDEDGTIGNKLIVRTYGLVEFDDGTIHKVAPECITFSDKHVISVNIDYDMIAEVAAKMMKD